MNKPPTVGVGDVLPSFAVYAGLVSLGGYLLEEWSDHGGFFALVAGIVWVVSGGGAAAWFAVRWWQVTHREPPALVPAESTSGAS
jgi:hypothetical protein